MRVTGGLYRGRILKSAPGLATRPTTDKIRQAIFNILMNDIEGTEVLDLFAGSGAIGIEAISRGADSVLFVENGYQPILFIKENLHSLDLDCELIELDYITAERLILSQKAASPGKPDIQRWASAQSAIGADPMI